MGANPKQALGIVLMLVAFTLLAASFAGRSIVLGVLALALLAAASFVFVKCKPLEHE